MRRARPRSSASWWQASASMRCRRAAWPSIPISTSRWRAATAQPGRASDCAGCSGASRGRAKGWSSATSRADWRRGPDRGLRASGFGRGKRASDRRDRDIGAPCGGSHMRPHPRNPAGPEAARQLPIGHGMTRIVLRRLLVFRSILFLAAAPVLAQDRADSVLVLADDGALEAPAVRAIRNVAATELRKRGVAVSEDHRTEGTRPLDATLSALASELGARRLFALRVGGRLGQKIPLSLEGLSPGSLSPIYAASLTAVGLDECDLVTARLVRSVVDRRTSEGPAGVRPLPVR